MMSSGRLPRPLLPIKFILIKSPFSWLQKGLLMLSINVLITVMQFRHIRGRYFLWLPNL